MLWRAQFWKSFIKHSSVCECPCLFELDWKAEVVEDHLSIFKNAVQRCNCAYERIYANACAYRQKTDGEVTADFVLSLTLTAQTKTKSHKLHNALFFSFWLSFSLSNAETSGSSEGSEGEKVLNIRGGPWWQVLERESEWGEKQA